MKREWEISQNVPCKYSWNFENPAKTLVREIRLLHLNKNGEMTKMTSRGELITQSAPKAHSFLYHIVQGVWFHRVKTDQFLSERSRYLHFQLYPLILRFLFFIFFLMVYKLTSSFFIFFLLNLWFWYRAREIGFGELGIFGWRVWVRVARWIRAGSRSRRRRCWWRRRGT